MQLVSLGVPIHIRYHGPSILHSSCRCLERKCGKTLLSRTPAHADCDAFPTMCRIRTHIRPCLSFTNCCLTLITITTEIIFVKRALKMFNISPAATPPCHICNVCSIAMPPAFRMPTLQRNCHTENLDEFFKYTNALPAALARMKRNRSIQSHWNLGACRLQLSSLLTNLILPP